MVGISTNQFAYDPAGNLRELRDGKNQLTSWGYDSYGRVAGKTNAANAAILAYAYDANSRLTNRWSAAKGNTAYSYDAVGNLTNINYPTSTDLQALDLLKQTVGKWCNRGGGGGNSGGPTFGPSPSVVNNIAWGTVLAGGAIIVGTLAADVFTGGVSIADDPATIAAGIALIGVGLNGGNEMH